MIKNGILRIWIAYIGERYAITQATATLILRALARDTDRIVSIHVATPKVAKASTIRVAVAGVIALTFENGNTA